eukprot:207189_1
MYLAGNDFGQMFMISNFQLKSTIISYSFNTLPPPIQQTPPTVNIQQTNPPITLTTQPRKNAPVKPITTTLPNIPGQAPGSVFMTTPGAVMTTSTTSATILTPGPGQQLGAFCQICDITTSSSVCVDPT